MISSTHFQYITSKLTSAFVNKAAIVAPKKWQAIISPQPMRELLNTSFVYKIPGKDNMVAEIKPNLPWADTHFEERISGQPMNPGESYKEWPFYKMDKEMRPDGRFSHTYMERFWPKYAGKQEEYLRQSHGTPIEKSFAGVKAFQENKGIRYEYGDLNDVVKQICEDPLTRQAYLPVFFPEDTGNTMGQRVPCTIGYHFIIREDKLHVVYYIRSCDYIRHFRDDVYLAVKLVHWMIKELGDKGMIYPEPGTLTMHITSLHVFESDMYRIKKEYEKNNQR